MVHGLQPSLAMRLLVLSTLLASGCLADQGGAIVFPARYDLAPVTMSQGSSGTSGMHVAGALSWASVSPNPQNRIDVAVGYQAERYVPPDRPDGEPAEGPFLHGPILELGYRLWGDVHRRIWLSARGELLAQQIGGHVRAGSGGILRLSGEVFASGRGSNHIGSVGIGPFVELGARELPGGPIAVVGLAGLSIRLPLAAAD